MNACVLGWRARGGTIIYGLAINPSLRMMYYAEYSRIHYVIVMASLDDHKIKARYNSSSRVGHRYFSSGLVGSRYGTQSISTEYCWLLMSSVCVSIKQDKSIEGFT